MVSAGNEAPPIGGWLRLLGKKNFAPAGGAGSTIQVASGAA